MATMTPQEFNSLGEALYGGHGWRTRIADALGVTRRTVDRYSRGATEVPHRVVLALETIKQQRIKEIRHG